MYPPPQKGLNGELAYVLPTVAMMVREFQMSSEMRDEI